MHKAPGQSLLSYVKQFMRDPNNEYLRETIRQAYVDIGRAMATFYKQYQRHGKNGQLPIGITHGDFHVGNIFYKQGRIFLIDNASMANSIYTPKECGRDIAVLLVVWVQFLPHRVRNEWLGLTIPNFFTGFLSTYPENERQAVYGELQKYVRRSRDWGADYIDMLERLRARLMDE